MFGIGNNIKLADEQILLIKAISDDLNMPKEDIAYFLIDLSIGVLISSRKIVDGKEALEKVMETVAKLIREDENIARMAQELHLSYEAGAQHNETEKQDGEEKSE